MDEHLGDATHIKGYAVGNSVSIQCPFRRPLCHKLRHSLGTRLRQFHSWVLLPVQFKLHNIMNSNKPMQEPK